jgi:L-amino acid N-acyltransferase YncA
MPPFLFSDSDAPSLRAKLGSIRWQSVQGSSMNTAYDIGVATADDIPELLALQAENQVSRGGALSIEFPAIWFENVVREVPIVIARRDGRLVGYLVSSPREAARNYPLIQAKFSAYPAGPDAYSSGPLCIDASDRSRGLAARLFDLQKSLLRGREGVAFIRRDNAASRAAHAKYGFLEVAEFSHLGIEYLVAARAAPAPDGHAESKGER